MIGKCDVEVTCSSPQGLVSIAGAPSKGSRARPRSWRGETSHERPAGEPNLPSESGTGRKAAA